jgi:diadenosine tetraphosphate (Ap4A) HIT family hydrolase
MRIRNGQDPQLLARMPSGWAILGNQQPEPIQGCCMLLPDLQDGSAPAQLNDLGPREREAFLRDLALLGDVVLEATGAERINYLILCNQVPELHGHVVPRFASEAPELRRLGPFEAYGFADAPRADVTGPHRELYSRLKGAMDRLLDAQRLVV